MERKPVAFSDLERASLWIILLILIGREFGLIYAAVPLSLALLQFIFSVTMKGRRNVD